MNELTTVSQNLPEQPGEIANFVLINEERLVAVRAGIRAMKKAKIANDVIEQKQEEARKLSELVLDAQIKLGELLNETPQEHNNNPCGKNQYGGQQSPTVPPTLSAKQSLKAELNITNKKAKQYALIAKHPEVVAKAKAQAKADNDIVSRSLVLNMIRTEKEKESREERKQETQKQIEAGSHNIDIFTTEEKYRVIYADPPWQYNDKQNTEYYGGAEKYYPTMPLDKICELPIERIAENNAVLFLWTTSPMLEDSFKVIRSWGFKYKSSFIWDKVKTGMGHYNSVRHEFLLICTKGSCIPDAPTKFDSVVSIPRSDTHSEKPAEFREMIAKLYEGKKIELFARNNAEGWDCWGNMV